MRLNCVNAGRFVQGADQNGQNKRVQQQRCLCASRVGLRCLCFVQYGHGGEKGDPMLCYVRDLGEFQRKRIAETPANSPSGVRSLGQRKRERGELSLRQRVGLLFSRVRVSITLITTGNGKGEMEGGSVCMCELRRLFSLELGYLHSRKLLKLDIPFLRVSPRNRLDD